MPSNATVHPIDAKAATYALVEAAMTAGYAPSIHNTQPWRWRLGGKTLELFIERGRVLDVIDQDGRLAMLSCGTALHHARVSLAAQGWQVTVTRMPDHTRPDCLAQLVIGGHRIAVGQPVALHQRIIPLRHTDRRPVTGAPVDPESIEAITASVEAEDTWLHILHPDQVLDLASAARHAQDVDVGESGWSTELDYWTGGDRPAGAGVPHAATPDRIARMTLPGRDVGQHGAHPISAAHDTAAVYAMLYGHGDEPPDWLRAGEALSAGWLTATEHGDSVLPLCAPAEVTSTRQAMRVMIASIGYPYLVLRLGVVDPGDPGPPHAPRLPADQTIERS
jgi:hypothetical protein